MDVASVTLEEVLKAAQIRAASLVPETSGYLALAVADASARLPYRIEDDMVVLSTEGTVKVMRGTEVVAPEVSAALVRSILERLLASSVGSMQGLSQAARPREETRDGVPGVILELEGALVPVNRSAARRALARLAREVARARDRGKLDRVPARRRVRPAAEAPPAPRPLPAAERVAPSPAAAPSRRAPEEPSRAHEPMPAPVPAPAARAAAPLAAETPLDAIDVTFTEPPSPVSEPVAEVHEPTPTIIATTLGEVEGLLLDRIVDDAGRKAPRGEAAGASSATKRGRKGREPAADKPLATSVDDLLRSFSVSAYDADGAMKATQQLFFADLDAAPADPAEPVASAAEEPPPMAPAARDASIVPARARDRRAAFGSRSVALLAVGLVLAGLIGHYAPALFSL